jgi:hypothetical protein
LLTYLVSSLAYLLLYYCSASAALLMPSRLVRGNTASSFILPLSCHYPAFTTASCRTGEAITGRADGNNLSQSAQA